MLAKMNRLFKYKHFIPYTKQFITEEDIEAVTQTLRSDWLTTGPKLREFETQFADYVQSKHCVAVNSGTAALHLAMLALDLQQNDHVIVPAITFAATANAVKMVGANVIFTDIDPNTGLVTEETLKKTLADNHHLNIKAIIVVHMNGHCPDMKAIQALAQKHNLFLVEDACHALGGIYKDNQKAIGSCDYSDLCTFSFHPAKHMTTGEGGAITTNSNELRAKLNLLRAHGITKSPAEFVDDSQSLSPEGKPNAWYYEMQTLGFNYRISDINCALGISQLKKMPMFVEKRKQLQEHYDALLKERFSLCKPITKSEYCIPSFHLYSVRIDFEQARISRNALMNALKELNIGTQVHYMPLYRHPYYLDKSLIDICPGAEQYYKQQLSLPFYYSLKQEEIEFVVEALSEFIE